MTSLDDAETDIIRKLDELDARAVAEKLVAIRSRRGMLGDEIAVEGSPWISDFRHIRALSYWTLVQIERRYGMIHVRARQDIGDDWNVGAGEDLGLAIDDLILLVANRGDHDLSVSDETMRNLIEIRQERGREHEVIEIDEDGNFVPTTIEEREDDGPPGPPTPGEVYAMLEVGDHVVLNGIEYVVAVPCGPGFRTSIRTRPITGGIIEDVTFDDWIAQNGRKRDPSEYMPAPADQEDEDPNVYRPGDGPTFVDTATDFGFPEPPPDPRLSLPAGSMAILERLEVGDMVEVEPAGRLEVIATWKSNPELVAPASGGILGVDDRSRVYRFTSSEWEIGSGRYVNLQHEEAMRRLRRRDRDDVPF